MLFNAESVGPGDSAVLTTPVIYTDEATCLSFFYFLYGLRVEGLTVEGVTQVAVSTLWQAGKTGREYSMFIY